MIAPYKYKKARKASAPKVGNRVHVQNAQEELTGFVNGWEASDIEERFANALRKSRVVAQFSFRDHYFGPARNTPGAIEVDFMVMSGGNWWPIQIDGEMAHKTVGQRQADAEKDARLNQYFSRYGINPVQRIPDLRRFTAGILDTQEGANEVVDEVFG